MTVNVGNNLGNIVNAVGNGLRSGISYINASTGTGSTVGGKYILFNKTHKNSAPKPKGRGPNGGRLQSHHGYSKNGQYRIWVATLNLLV